VADEMFSVGVVLLVLDRTDSASLAGVTVAAALLPAVLTGPVIGAWIDRSGRRSLLYKVDRVVLASALVAILLAAGNTPDFVLPLIALVAGVTFPATFGGFTSLIPFLVEEDLLPPANAVEAASFNMALILGPALAGTLAAAFSPAAALVVEAGLTLAALVLILRIPGLNTPGTGNEGSLRQTVFDGLRHIVREPVIRAVSVTGILNMIGLGILTVAFPLWAAADLGVGESAGGHLWAAFAFGSLVGALALAGVQRRHAQDRILFGGLLIQGLVMFTWPLASSLPVALMLVAVGAVSEGPALAATFAVRQQRTPRNLQGGVMTTLGSMKVGAFALGAGVAGPIVGALGPSDTMLVVAGVQVFAVAVGFAMSLLAGEPSSKGLTPA
jgi:predicted MFS family arabinose efflux permease